MGPPQRQQPDHARPAGSACVWVVAVVLLLAVLAGGGCLVLYVTLPPAEVPHWLPAAGLALVGFPWAFWIATCAYRCCCSGSDAAAPVASNVERQASSRKAVAPMPSSTSLKGARSARHAAADGATPASGSPTASSAARRVRFGDTTVLGEEHAPAAAAGDKDDDGSSVHSNESEAPLAYNMEPSS